MENVIEKIQKLLRLADSPNEHEAQQAMLRAQKLMLKHNIEMSQIVDKVNEYTTEKTGDRARPAAEDKFVHHILGKFFFVKVLESGHRGRIHNIIIGEKANVQTALYVKEFLTESFRRLLKEYNVDNGLEAKSLKHRSSFYFGLYSGFCAKMEQQQAATAQEYGLVVVEDPKLKEKVSEMFPDMTTKKQTVRTGNLHAVIHGQERGRNLSVARPLE